MMVNCPITEEETITDHALGNDITLLGITLPPHVSATL